MVPPEEDLVNLITTRNIVDCVLMNSSEAANRHDVRRLNKFEEHLSRYISSFFNSFYLNFARKQNLLALPGSLEMRKMGPKCQVFLQNTLFSAIQTEVC